MIQKETILIAIDECEMEGTGTKTLTIGKEYKVIDVDNPFQGDFIIRNDIGDFHYFITSEYKEFFKLKKEV